MKKSIAFSLVVLVGSGLLWFFSSGQFAAVADSSSTDLQNASLDVRKQGLPSLHQDVSANLFAQTLDPSPGQLPLDYRPSDPIVLAPCTLNPIKVQEVSSQLDGQFVKIEVNLGQKVPKGHCLARLDNRKLLLQTQLLEIRAHSLTEELIARALFEEADAKVAYAQKANTDNWKAVPELELKTYLAQRERYAQEIKKAQEERQAAKKELEKGLVLLGQHNITSNLDGEVVKIYKKEGETVKQAETVFRISRMDRLLIEGYCKVQNAHQLTLGMPVQVEPEVQGRQLLELVGHTDTITDLAISADGKILASASSDGKVLLWSWPAGQRIGLLSHPAPVHAVDLTADQKGNYLVVTGCDDGRARLWSISGGSIKGPLAELRGHEGAIRCVRLDRSGKTCATAGEDRKIGWWEMPTGKNLGWVHATGAWKQSAHQGAVTHLQFGSDNRLISTGTDNVQKVWQLDDNKVELLKIHRGRTGDVHRLGLAPDGQRMLFDHGDELRLINSSNGAVEGTLQSWKTLRFQEFACFSPTGRTILAASADGRLGLWKTPQPQVQSFEICYFLPPRAGKVKCATFAPDEKVFFSGGTDHVVRVWTIPEASLWEPRQAILTYVSSEIEQGTDLVRIQAEMSNPDSGPQRLFPGTMVVLKVLPQTEAP